MRNERGKGSVVKDDFQASSMPTLDNAMMSSTEIIKAKKKVGCILTLLFFLMPTAPGIPRQSPTQVLTKPDPA